MIPLEKLQKLLPPRLLDTLAVELAVNAPNQVRLPGQAVFLCLLNTVVNHPVVTQRLLEETYTRLFGTHADHSSFGKRLAVLAPAYFQGLFLHLDRQLESALPRIGLIRRVRRVDATTVTASAKWLHFGLLQRANQRAKNQTAKRHVKAVLELSEVGLPQLLRVCREPAEANDNPALGESMVAATTPGDLWVFDGGCKDRDRLLTLHRRESYWLTPHGGQRLRGLDEEGRVWETPEPPAVQAAGRAELAAAARAHPKDPAPYRLLRVERAVFENADDARHPTWQAKWATMPLLGFHGERYNRRTQAWEPLVLLTNLPLSADRQQAGPYRLAEVPEVYRRRWDLEVFFKFIKQHLGYAHLVSFQENGIHLLLWMTLIAALLLIWYQRETGINRGWRSVKFWFAEDARDWTEGALRAASGLTPGRRPQPTSGTTMAVTGV